MKRTALTLIASFAFAATAAHAVEYGQVQPDKSRIAFDYQQVGVAMQGTFGKFASELRFDPAAPQSASATSRSISPASIPAARKATRRLPTARPGSTPRASRSHAESSVVKTLGGDKYEVAGKLTIKGTTKDVVVPATFTAQGDSGVFEGA